MSLSSERDRIQRQVEELERSLSVTQTELDLLSSDTGDESDDEGMEDEMGQSAAGLLAQREKIQKEIQNLENFLGQHSSICVSDDEDSSSSEESDLGLSATPDSCLQLNLVYQQVLQDTLDQLETLLTQNRRQQRELITQMSGPIKAPPRDQPPRSSYQLPAKMFLGRFLKPYFKDKLTGLGPPANQEGKQRVLRMTGCLDDKRLKPKRWESWQKTLLIHSVARDSLKRLMQPKLSRVDYLTQKLSSASEADRQQLKENINALEKEIDLLRQKKEEELVGDRYEEHDWQKISNIDFEGTKYAEDIRLFWQNFLHPSINKSSWTKEEVQQLKEVSRSHQEMHWEDIAEELGTGRTAFMCLQMFQRFVSSSLKRGPWAPDEDILLRELVDKMRIGNFIPYTQMSYFMEGRDPTQLIYRWNQVLDPSLKKGPWSKEEDQLLLQAVARHGEKWWKVRLEVPGRTDSACRDRYLDCLRMDVKKGSFDKQEQELLQALVEKHGVGRWSKIAAEIPHRLDAQCMREWRKLSRPNQLRKRKTMRRREKNEGNRRRDTSKSRLRKRLVQIKEKELTEEEEEEEEDEEEDSVVPYMDSDEDEEKRKRQRKKMMKKKTETLVKEKDELQEEEEKKKKEEEEEEEEYILPPIQNWLSAETSLTPPSLNFCPAMLPSFSESGSGDAVRSTIVAKSGRSVIIGPRPRELRWEERHSSGAMMMASHDQLRAHCSCLVLKLRNPGGRNRTGPRNQTVCNRITEYELQAAVTPWVGHLLVASTARRTVADSIKKMGELRGVSSTAVFLLLLQVMNVDTHGCKDTIERRKKRTRSQAPPPPVMTVAGLLQQRRTMMQQEGEDQEQRRQLLLQLEEVQAERRKNRGARLLVQVSQPRPHLPFQVPPQVTPVLLRQPLLPPPSIHFIPPPSLNKTLPAPIRALLPRAYATSLPTPPITVVSNTTPTPHHTTPTGHPSHQPPLSNSWGAATGVGEANTNMGGANTGVGGDTEDRRILEQSQVKAAVQEVETSTSTCSNQLASVADGLNLAPPSSTVTMELPGPSIRDHDYTLLSSGPTWQSSAPQKSVSTNGRAPSGRAPKCPAKGRKREREKEEQEEAVGRSHAEHSADGSGTGVVQDEKRLRRPSLKARALQEEKQAQLRHRQVQAEVKRSASLSPRKRPRKCCAQDAMATQTPPPPRTMCLTPGQTMWVMTPAGLVQLAPAPPLGLVQLSQAPPPGLALTQSSPLPPKPEVTPHLLLTLPPHTAALPVQNPSAVLTLPYGGVVKVDSAKDPLLRTEALQFDPSLIFPECQEAVRDWLSGRGGVVVPGARMALPYMPPFVGSLSALSALLRSMKSLKMTSLQLLNPPRCRPKPTHQSRAHAAQPELADSIVHPPGGPSDSPTTGPLEEEQVKAVRRLVAERFSTNPAYQLLKARFLSCFTVPALLATIQPVATEMMTHLTEEEEEEEEEELRRIEERGRQRRTERSLLLSEGCGAPANHFSGIRNADKNATNQTTQDQ